MKRFLAFLATFSLVELIGRYPARAGALTLLGVGGAVVGGSLITPSIVPQPSAYINNQNGGVVNNALALPANSALLPATPENSFAYVFEGEMSPALGYNTAETQYLLGTTSTLTGAVGFGLQVSGNGTGLPSWYFQTDVPGSTDAVWWSAVSTNILNSSVSAPGASGQNGGYYAFTATGGCQRPPSGEDGNGLFRLSDPGFLCGTPPSVDMTQLTGLGQKQATGAGGITTTCVSNSPVAGEMTVTAHVANPHGYIGGQTYALSGFTPSGYNATYIALAGTTGATLVGETTTGGGTCPAAVSIEGQAFAGAGPTLTFPYNSATTPFSLGGLGITTMNAQHFCGVIGEYGADSPFPGAQFASFVDDQGNALPGAPALVPWLNQGTANFTGYVTTGAQPELTVTAMNPYSITGANYSGGLVTFTTSTSPGFIAGSEFTVSGMTPSGYNQTYVAVAGTSGTTIVGNALSRPVGRPQTLSNPGAFVSGGQMVSVIMPNTEILGTLPTASVISPYGTSGATGTGGVGTYALSFAQASNTLTASQTGTVLTVSAVAGGSQLLVPGDSISGAGMTTDTILSYGTATGAAGTYNVSVSQTVGSESMTNAGTIWSSGSPGTLFAAPLFYQTLAGDATNPPAIGKVTPRTQASFGNFIASLGSSNTNNIIQRGWSGTLANAGMLWGVFPQDSSGAPSTAALASLCKKTTDYQAFAAAKGLTIRSLYRLSDLGIFADSSVAQFTGSITGASGSTATLNISSTQTGALTGSGTATIAGPGIPGCPSACPTIPLGPGPTYTVTWGSAIAGNVSIEAMTAGNFKPATPVATGLVTGYIDAPGGVPTLHVTDFAAGTQTAKFTASLGNVITASASTTTLTVTSPTAQTALTTPAIAIGSTVVDSSGNTSTVTGFIGAAQGGAGQYTISPGFTVASENMLVQGSLASPANGLLVTATASGAVANRMLVTDGGAKITSVPLQINGGSATNGIWSIIPTYYPAFSGDSAMVGALTALVPGQYVLNSAITTPVKIIGFGANTTGGIGTYILSNNANGLVGSSGLPVTFSLTGITDGGPVPTPALTIKDLGPGVTFPVNNFVAGTGTLNLSGTFDTSVLGGTPTVIQAQVSLTAGGPPVSGCSACAWTNLTGYSATLSSGTVFNWSGQAINIPGAFGPLYVSVRAANGPPYATMPSYIKVGTVFDINGEGQWGAIQSTQAGANLSTFSGLWNASEFNVAGNPTFTVGPSIIGNLGPGQTLMWAGDRYDVAGGAPMVEGVGTFEQDLTTAFNWPSGVSSIPRDGIGMAPSSLGNTLQTQTISVGDGSTTTWCSQTIFCSTAGQGGTLDFTAASLTGAQFTGSVSTTAGVSTLTVSAMQLGAMEPGQVLSGAGISGSPTLVRCSANCNAPWAGTGGTLSSWILSANLGTVGSETMRADVSGGSPWPLYDIQVFGNNFVSGFGAQLIKAGTFEITVNGTVVCQDTSTFAYNVQGGTCAGAGISSSYINYATGDYSVTFTTPPANGAAIIASWTGIISPENLTAPATQRPPGFDFFGDGTPQSGTISALMSKTPGGVSGHVFAGGISDAGIMRQNGYYASAPGYSQMVAWLYGTKYLIIPGETASTPMFIWNTERAEGPTSMTSNVGAAGQTELFAQWEIDAATPSNFTGTIASNLLTLTANAVGPMWEGEVIGCNPFSLSCAVPSGVYITSLASGAWGQSGSTYNLANASGVTVSSTLAMLNAVYIQGPMPIYNIGTMNDWPIQSTPPTNLIGVGPHPTNGFTGGRRTGARMASLAWGALSNPSSPNAAQPTMDRVKADAVGCDTSALASPCFDVGGTYAASHSGTISGSTITITGGIAAGSITFVPGELITCSGCTAGRVIQSISVPPTADSRSGQGEVGQTFVITANGSLGVSTTETVTAGCSGTSGVGSNCIDVAFSINTPGSYGSAAALATCGENNLAGPAFNGTLEFAIPNGTCQTRGVGSLVRTFRIGTSQAPWGGITPATLGLVGSPYDDGADGIGGVFNQSAAFTCRIVAAKVVQCVKAPLYTSGVATGVGQWPVGSTYLSYGDGIVGTGREGSLVGNVGGQSFGFTAGSGYTNGTYPIYGTCTFDSGGWPPAIDVTISGGSIIDVYGSTQNAAIGLSTRSTCTWPLNATFTASIATSNLMTVTGTPGTYLGPGTVVSDGGVHLASPITITSQASGTTGGAGTYHTTYSGSAVASETMTAGSPGGSGGAITTMAMSPLDGAYGILTYASDSNWMGDLLYDNSGLPGNPLNSFFACPIFSGYCEPGLPVTPIGQFLGAAVSG